MLHKSDSIKYFALILSFFLFLYFKMHSKKNFNINIIFLIYIKFCGNCIFIEFHIYTLTKYNNILRY